MTAHGTKPAAGIPAPELAEISLAAFQAELDVLCAYDWPTADRPARRNAIAAAARIEQRLERTLAPLADSRAPAGTVMIEAALRRAIVAALGLSSARDVRKASAPPGQDPILICRGNPLFGPEMFDEHGPYGCGLVFRGQWRVVNRGDRQVALGPRCKRCNRRMTEDLRAQVGRRQAGLADLS